MVNFFMWTVVGRITGILMILAIGGVALLLTGDGDPKTPKQKAAEEIGQANVGVEEAADSAALGLQVVDARNKLMVDGDLDRYRIQRMERSEQGDLNVFTDLPAGKASQAKVSLLCEKLIGGDPPLVEVTDFVFVFGKGVTHIRADQCDVQFWE